MLKVFFCKNSSIIVTEAKNYGIWCNISIPNLYLKLNLKKLEEKHGGGMF